MQRGGGGVQVYIYIRSNVGYGWLEIGTEVLKRYFHNLIVSIWAALASTS